MNELQLFAGAGGGILGGILLGHTTVCAVEIEPYCREVLLQRQRDGILPRFPIWDDIKTFDGQPWRGRVDVVCGGFPCQDISVAGKGAGIGGQRSGLWAEMARVVGEVQPRYVFVENSPMLTSRGLDRVLGDLSTLGYDARWGVVGAQHAGGVHKRERIWILANANKNGCKDETSTIKNKSTYTGEIFTRWWGQLKTERLAGRISYKLACESSTNAFLCGMDDGVADQVDRLEAIGNGQVPAVAALAWRVLTDELYRQPE